MIVQLFLFLGEIYFSFFFFFFFMSLYMGLFCSLSDGSYLAILLSLLVLIVVTGGVFRVSYKSCRNRIVTV